MIPSQSENAVTLQLLKAISTVDQDAIRNLCHEDVELQVPGAREVDLTAQRTGVQAFIDWSAEVHRLCGETTFNIHRDFQNGCELMASGTLYIHRHPRVFCSPCAILIRFEAGRAAFFQLLLDTYALEKFRGQMD